MLITIKSNDITKGTVNTILTPNVTSTVNVPNGSAYDVPLNAAVVMTAQPNAGCQFVCWNDGNTNSVRNITVTGNNITYMAIFARTVNNYPRIRFIRNRRSAVRQLFSSLTNNPMPIATMHNPCPNQTLYNGLGSTTNPKADKLKEYQCDTQKSCSGKLERWLLPLLTIIIVGVFVLFALNGCTTQHISKQQSTNNSTSIHADINPSFEKNDNRNFSVNVDMNSQVINQTVYDTVVINDSSYVVAHPCNTTIYTINHHDSDWIKLLYRFLIATLLAVIIILAIRYLTPLYHKRVEFENRMQEKWYSDYVRLLDEDRKYEMHVTEATINQWERREKIIVDEWSRDNEHVRKLDIMERERIANMSNLLEELAKIKNMERFTDNNGNTTTYEQSILS